MAVPNRLRALFALCAVGTQSGGGDARRRHQASDSARGAETERTKGRVFYTQTHDGALRFAHAAGAGRSFCWKEEETHTDHKAYAAASSCIYQGNIAAGGRKEEGLFHGRASCGVCQTPATAPAAVGARGAASSLCHLSCGQRPKCTAPPPLLHHPPLLRSSITPLLPLIYSAARRSYHSSSVLTVTRRSSSRGKMRSSDHARSSDAKIERFSYGPCVKGCDVM